MSYKISGVITHDGRVIVIRTDNYTIETNTLVSGTLRSGGYSAYKNRAEEVVIDCQSPPLPKVNWQTIQKIQKRSVIQFANG